MNAMMFAYVAARQREIERQANCRERLEQSHPMRDRLGRTLISWGEHLIGMPRWPYTTGQGGAGQGGDGSVRSAA